jgi:hypothetical protein
VPVLTEPLLLARRHCLIKRMFHKSFQDGTDSVPGYVQALREMFAQGLNKSEVIYHLDIT